MRKTSLTRFISFLMALLMMSMTLFMAVSCSQPDEPSEETTEQSTQATETETPSAYDTVEKEVFDREMSFMMRDSRMDYYFN